MFLKCKFYSNIPYLKTLSPLGYNSNYLGLINSSRRSSRDRLCFCHIIPVACASASFLLPYSVVLVSKTSCHFCSQHLLQMFVDTCSCRCWSCWDRKSLFPNPIFTIVSLNHKGSSLCWVITQERQVSPGVLETIWMESLCPTPKHPFGPILHKCARRYLCQPEHPSESFAFTLGDTYQGTVMPDVSRMGLCPLGPDSNFEFLFISFWWSMKWVHVLTVEIMCH